MNNALEQVAAAVREESGFEIKVSQYAALSAAIGRVAGVEPESFLALARDPSTGSEAINSLIDEITVKETSFLRDGAQLETISWEMLLQVARDVGAPLIRTWSAGCATGEEAYTLALLASEAFAPAPPPIRILATDISRLALARAREAAYGRRSVRDVSPALRDLYFDPAGELFRVGERLRRLVHFTRHNLVRDPIPPLGEAPFHLILCRNLLIYFDGATAKRVVGLLERALAPGGVLVLGAADALCVTDFESALTSGSWRLKSAAAMPPKPQLRRPLGLATTEDEAVAHAVRAADDGDPNEAREQASRLLAENPLDAKGHFLQGLVELESGDAGAAVKSLRRALYVFPTFALAAFKLGRAYDALGNSTAARRAYEQALRTIEPAGEHEELFLEQVDVGDIAGACRARIRSLQ